jgi:hypothetical protein
MGHFAKVVDGKVSQVIVAEPDFFDTFVDSSPGQWIQTSYNTRGNVHYLPISSAPSGQPGLRGNYDGIGYTYDAINDVFYPEKPYNSCTLSETTWSWEAPIIYPNDGKYYTWDESNISWKEVTVPEA